MDSDLDGGDKVDRARAGGREPRTDADACEREPEGVDIDARAERDAERVVDPAGADAAAVLRGTAARQLVQPGVDVEVAAEAEPAAADRNSAVQVDAEVRLRVDPAGRVQGRKPEEVGVAGEEEEPLAVADDLVVRGVARAAHHVHVAADDDVDRRTETDHVEQADAPVDVEPERVVADRDPVDGVVVGRRVQPDLAGALDLDDVEQVEVDADVELQHEAAVAARGVDAGEAAGQQVERAERDVDVELDRERVLVDRDRRRAGRGHDPDEADRAVDRQQEARVDRHGLPVTEVDRLRDSRGAEVERGARAEVEPDRLPEVRAHADGRAHLEPVAVDPERSGYVPKGAEARERDARVRRRLDHERARRELEGERAVDRHERRESQVACELQIEAARERDTAGRDRVRARVEGELIRIEARVAERTVSGARLPIGDERDGRCRRGRTEEQVHLEQEHPAEGDAWYRARVHRQLDPADDPRVEGVTRIGRERGVAREIDGARQRTEVLDVRRHRALDPDVRRGADLQGHADRAGERDDVLQRDRAGDDRLDVEAGLVRGRQRAVDVRCRPRDRDRRREVVRQDGEELLRHLEHLVGQRRVERHAHAAVEGDDRRDVAQARAVVVRAGRACSGVELDAEEAGDARDARRVRVVADDQKTRLATRDAERSDAAARGEEERRLARRDLQEEAAVHVHPLARRAGAAGERLEVGAALDRARVVERRGADHFDLEGDGREVVRPRLPAHDEDRVAVQVEVRLDEELPAVAVDDLPFLARDDALDLGVRERDAGEVLQRELLPRRKGERERQRRRVDRPVDVAIGARVSEEVRPRGGERDRVEHVGRERCDERCVVRVRDGEDRAARDALERERLGLRRGRRVDLEQCAALQEDPVLLEEVEVRLERGDAVELDAREAAPGLEHEHGRAGRDVADLDHVDGAGRGELEAHLRRAVGERLRPDRQLGRAADGEQRLLGRVTEQPARLEVDAAGQ